MKTHPLAATALLAAFHFAAAALPAASYTEAKVTRLEKDVKILKENAAPHAAIVGEKVNAVTSVATGASSRAELQFPDNSLTRLGANSRFTIRGQGHTIDLDKGVLLFEVPEKLRDAKVRTAAVTAAVTGGTFISEFMPPNKDYPQGFMKIMVIEGTVDSFLNDKPSEFVTLHAGQMIIQPLNATTMSPPVDFDLKLLLKTSKLLKGDGDPNAKEINEALNAQQSAIQDGSLLETQIIFPGLGIVAQLNNNTRFEVINPLGQRNGTPGTPPVGGAAGGAGGGPAGPQFQGVVPLITGITVLNAHGTVKTDPQVTAYNVATGSIITSDGSVYHPAIDGPFPYFGFGSLQIADPDLKTRLEAKSSWAAYKFEKLLINGTPQFDLPTLYCGEQNYVSASFSSIVRVDNTIPNIILSAVGNITLAADNQFATGEGSAGESTSNSLNTKNVGLESLVLFSQNGSIDLQEGFSIKASNQEYSIVAAGATSDVTIEGDIKIYTGSLLVSAGQDLKVNGGRITADNGMILRARRDIMITNSAQLKALAELPVEALLRLESLEGEITVNGSDIQGTNIEIEAFKGNISVVDSTLTATHALKLRTLRPDGTLLISGSTLTGGNGRANANDLIRLYAEGSGGKVLFQGNVTLSSDEVQIAGKTVQVDPGGAVNVTQGNAHIFSNNHNYNSGNFGTINSTNLKQYPYGGQPDFKTGGKLGRPPL